MNMQKYKVARYIFWGALAALISFFAFTEIAVARGSESLDRVKTYIENRVKNEGPGFLQDILPKLASPAKRNKNLFAAGQVHALRLRIEKEYGASGSLITENTTWKSSKKTFVLPDGSRFSQGTSTVKPSEVKRAEQTIGRTITSSSSGKSSIPTVSPKFQKLPDVAPTTKTAQSYGQEKVLLESKNTRVETPTTVEVAGKASVGVTIQLSDGTIDVARVQRAWQGWVNNLRASRSLAPLGFDVRLHKTGVDRVTTIRNKKSADHRRFSTSPYYSYPEITAWFKQRGVVFKNVSRATYTENIGWAGFYCTQGDCTDEAIESLQRTYQYFRDEEGKAYDAHWRTMIHPLFKVMGIGIAVDEADDKIYIAIHYGTEVLD